MRCDRCERQVPEGVFCTACGAHQGMAAGIGDRGSRLHRYAAHPGEHVATPSLLTTILPHLASHRIHEFRWALIAGVAVVTLLYATGVIVGAILVSAVLVPSLYLLYLHQAQVYRQQPARVLGLTMGLGAVLGVVVTLVLDAIITPALGRTGYAGAWDFIVATVIVPLVQVAVMSAPALLLRDSEEFSDTADGLVFGIAAGLGFAAAETIVRFSGVIAGLPVRTTAGDWIFPLLTICIFIPLLHGSTAGAIVASLWRPGRRGPAARFGALGVPVAAVVTIAFYVVSQILAENGAAPLVILGWQAVAVGAMLIYIRFLLHHALLEEGSGLGFSAQVCANCHRHIIAAGFCPACGMALSASARDLAEVTSTGVTTPARGA